MSDSRPPEAQTSDLSSAPDTPVAAPRRLSSIWLIPLLTLLVGGWFLFQQYRQTGPLLTLTAESAEGLQAGKTVIRNRDVTVGTVESVQLSPDLDQVIIQARLQPGMDKLLGADSVFWVVKPQIGREGISGLGTLLSGAYIGVQQGRSSKTQTRFALQSTPPRASVDAPGLRLDLTSATATGLNAGDPVLFRGFRVGTVEAREFDARAKLLHYQIFVQSPYEPLVTANTRFWLDSGVAFDMSSQGMRLEMGSLQTLATGGVSFDVPTGWGPGAPAASGAAYALYPNRGATDNGMYTDQHDFVLFFNQTIRGLQAGAPVEFRGIRLGTVAQAPLFVPPLQVGRSTAANYRIPVLVRIEPQRLRQTLEGQPALDVLDALRNASRLGVRASLKPGNLLTGNVYVDIDFMNRPQPWTGPTTFNGLPVLPTQSGGLVELQQKATDLLDKLNALPVEPVLRELQSTLADSRKTLDQASGSLRSATALMASVNEISRSPAVRELPQDVRNTLGELNRTLATLQPGGQTQVQLTASLQQLERSLRQLQPLLSTLGQKSNALILPPRATPDPVPLAPPVSSTPPSKDTP
ncbi:intermembrane transport protein PqiB [Amphibiibacter pelophylacis]|uniref:Intermembrane transport protein PqiB n=1 Tax=Amphibiibacter pelophylacis TaxID=1799477 RepID=A0ACC6NZK2_9BURK